jgi:hypothetical protein
MVSPQMLCWGSRLHACSTAGCCMLCPPPTPHPVHFLAGKHDVVAILCEADCSRPCLQGLLRQQLPCGHFPHTQLTLGRTGQ